jgi:hypothetical protein
VHVESLEVVTDTLLKVGCGESDSVGGNECTAGRYVGLDTNGIYLRFVGEMHCDDLVSNQVRTDHQRYEGIYDTDTNPGATSSEILKVQVAALLLSVSEAHS